jgi:hypothetical protein
LWSSLRLAMFLAHLRVQAFDSIRGIDQPAELYRIFEKGGEPELFGHERGTFINVLYRCVERLEEAGPGTLFLDEIGELPPALQAKLLRAIEERTIELAACSG